MTKEQIITHLLSFYKDVEFEERVFTPTDDHHEAFTEYFDEWKGQWTPNKKEVILGRVMRDVSRFIS